MNLFFKVVLGVFASVFLFPVISVSAAQFFFDANRTITRVGDPIEVGLFLKTENEDVNALEGSVVFPESLQLKEIKDGNSLLNFWIERPAVQNRKIRFSGIIPGGYMEKKGLVFSMIFEPVQEGSLVMEVQQAKVLLNDGLGTGTKTSVSNLQLVVLEKSFVSSTLLDQKKDTEIPEAFEPIITSDPSIFGGKYFLVFATQDKGSGIDQYFVCEGKKKCVIAESPYLLKYQRLNQEIIVRAVDKSGNVRSVVLPPKNHIAWYQDFLLIGILGVIALAIVGFLLQKIYERRRRKTNLDL